MSKREALYKAPSPNTLLLREIKYDTEAPCSPMVKESGRAGGSSHSYSQYAWKSRDSTSINNYSNKLQNFYWLKRIKADSHTFKFQIGILNLPVAFLLQSVSQRLRLFASCMSSIFKSRFPKSPCLSASILKEKERNRLITHGHFLQQT